MSGWQPIETAPRAPQDAKIGTSGPSFLAYEAGMMAVGCFISWGRGDLTFYVDHVGGHEFEQDINNPTHWMPLPEPPADAQGNRIAVAG